MCSNRVDTRIRRTVERNVRKKVHSFALARSCKFFLSTLRRYNVLNTVYHLDGRWFISIWENHDSLDEFPLNRSVTSTLAQSRAGAKLYTLGRWIGTRMLDDVSSRIICTVKNESWKSNSSVLGSEFWEWDSSQTESLGQIVTSFNGIDVVTNCERAKRKPKTVNRRNRHVMRVK